MRRTRLIVPAVARRRAWRSARSPAPPRAARPRHEADHDQEAGPQEGEGHGRDDRSRDGRDERRRDRRRPRLREARQRRAAHPRVHPGGVQGRPRACSPTRWSSRAQTALQYPTVADAEAAGLHRAGPFSPGLGAHYVDYGHGLGSPDGAMTDDAVRHPLAWIYDGTHPDSHIAGLFYGSAVKEPGRLRRDRTTSWHVHHDVCIKPSPTGIDAPLGADHDATQAAVRRGRRQPDEADAVPAPRVGGAGLREPRGRVRAPELRGHVRRRHLQDHQGRHQDRQRRRRSAPTAPSDPGRPAA